MSSDTKFAQSEHLLTTPHSAAIAGIIAGTLFITSHALIVMSLPVNGADLATGSHHTTASIAFQLLPFAGIAFLWFMGVVRDRLGRREDQFYSTVFLGSGLLYLAMTFTATALASGLWLFFSINVPGAIENVYNFGRSLVTQLTQVFGLRMASVFMLSSATMWMRTQVMPRWLAALTAVLALILLFTVGYSPWIPLLFPVWILLVSILILISNLRRKPAIMETKNT